VPARTPQIPIARRHAAAIALVAVAALAACAPPEAQYELSEAARSAPPARLLPTAAFDEARARGAADVARLGPETDAAAARAEALRARGAALSAAPVLGDAERARLEAAAAAE
jgi:hypothetical protein